MQSHRLGLHSDKVWADNATQNTLKYLTIRLLCPIGQSIWDIWKENLIGCP